MVLFSSFVSSISITRTFSVENYTLGVPLNVTLNVILNSNEKITNYGIEEIFPSSWKVIFVSSSDYYKNSSSKISWIINSSNNDSFLSNKTLRYTIIPTTNTTQNSFDGLFVSTSSNSSSPSMTQNDIVGVLVIFVNSSNPGNYTVNETNSSIPDDTPVSSGNGGGGGGGGGSKGVTVSSNLTNVSAVNNTQTTSNILESQNTEVEEVDVNETNGNNSNNIDVEKPSNMAIFSIVATIIILIIALIFIVYFVHKKI